MEYTKLMNILVDINTYLGEINRKNIEIECHTDLVPLIILCRELSFMVFLSDKAKYSNDKFTKALKDLRDSVGHGNYDFDESFKKLNSFLTKKTDSFACALVYETLKRFMKHFKLSDVERLLVSNIESSIAQNDVQRQARLMP